MSILQRYCHCATGQFPGAVHLVLPFLLNNGAMSGHILTTLLTTGGPRPALPPVITCAMNVAASGGSSTIAVASFIMSTGSDESRRLASKGDGGAPTSARGRQTFPVPRLNKRISCGEWPSTIASITATTAGLLHPVTPPSQ